MAAKLTAEQLLKVEEKAGEFFDTEKIAIMLNVSEKLLESGLGQKAYLRGRYTKESQFRKITIINAFDGNAASQKMVHEWIEESAIEIDYGNKA
jgi:nuclear transport factor 2 (NTF2) superfamily protein